MLNITEKKILFEIYKNKSLSRTDIAEKISITVAAVSQYCTELIAKNYILEIGKLSSKSQGRNKVLLSLNRDYAYVVGLAIEFDYFEIAISDFSGKEIISFKKKIEIAHMYVYLQQNLDNIYTNILNQANLYPSRILGVGITSANILSNSNFEFWKEEQKLFEITSGFAESYFRDSHNYTTIKSNNVHALALVEFLHSESEDNFICIKYGPRIGAALWLNGNLVKGAHNASGEISHLQLFDNLQYKSDCKICLKDNCLESIVSDQSIRSKISSIDNYQVEFAYLFKDFDLHNLSAFEVFIHYRKNITLEIIMNEVARALAKTIVTIESIIDSNKIILFGKSFQIKDFFELVVNYVNQYSGNYLPVDIVLAKSNPDKMVDSALFLILSNLFYL